MVYQSSSCKEKSMRSFLYIFSFVLFFTHRLGFSTEIHQHSDGLFYAEKNGVYFALEKIKSEQDHGKWKKFASFQEKRMNEHFSKIERIENPLFLSNKKTREKIDLNTLSEEQK